MLKACIDRFSFFSREVQFAGWAFVDGKSIVSIEFLIGGNIVESIVNINCASPDVEAHFGAAAANTRFHGRVRLPEGVDAPVKAALRFRLSDGTEEIRGEIGQAEINMEPGHTLYRRFLKKLEHMRPGRLLEIGSRARSGISRRHEIPQSWDYKGSDVVPGPNVDIVVDAHNLSSVIPARSIDAVMSISVFEHLAMPWKVAVELNRVMTKGAIGFVATHQMFPLHDQPWDFWRISADAWPALFNRVTGFRIIKAAMAEPGYMVAARWHSIVDLREQIGYALSSVMFEKIAETKLDWQVNPREVVVRTYPH